MLKKLLQLMLLCVLPQVVRAQIHLCRPPLELPNSGSIFRNEDFVIPVGEQGVVHVQKPVEKKSPYTWQFTLYDTLLKPLHTHYLSVESQTELEAYSVQLNNGIYMALPLLDKPQVQVVFISFKDTSARQFILPFQFDFDMDNMEANDHFLVFTGRHNQRDVAIYYEIADSRSYVVPNVYGRKTEIIGFFKQQADIKLFWRIKDRGRSIVRGASFEQSGAINYFNIDDERGKRIIHILRHDSNSVMGIFGLENSPGAMGIFHQQPNQTKFKYFAEQPGYLSQFGSRQKRKVKRRLSIDKGIKSIFWYERFLTTQLHEKGYTLFALEQYKTQQQTTPGYPGLFFPTLDQNDILRPITYGHKLDIVLGGSIDTSGNWLNLWSFDRPAVPVERLLPAIQILPLDGVKPMLWWQSGTDIYYVQIQYQATSTEVKQWTIPEQIVKDYPGFTPEPFGVLAWYGKKILITGIQRGIKAKDGNEDRRLLLPFCVGE
jgi:hypothetical protein